MPVPGQGREHRELTPTLKCFGAEVWYMPLLFTAHWLVLDTGPQSKTRESGKCTGARGVFG